MKTYDKNKDEGFTSILGKRNLSKDEVLFEVLGTIDELNASLGFLHTSRNKKLKETGYIIQNDLFSLGSLFAGSSTDLEKFDFVKKCEWLENIIKELNTALPALTNFILPGGSNLSTHLHLSRATCRRLERHMVSYFGEEKNSTHKDKLRYVNRLSDLLFEMARYANFKLGIKDLIWKN